MMKKITHKNITFRVEKINLAFVTHDQNPIRYQAFLDDHALSEIEENESIAIMMAIKTINENF